MNANTQSRAVQLIVCLLAICLLGLMVSTQTGAAEWQAGVARAVITPEKPVWLAGYGSKRPPDGKLHDLWMKALALQADDGRRVVLVTSDFQGVPKVMSGRVFEQIQNKYGIARHQVMLTFSHNHCGPRPAILGHAKWVVIPWQNRSYYG